MDAYLARRLLSSQWQDCAAQDAVHVVDLGFGDGADTSVELMDALSATGLRARCTAVDCEPARVARVAAATRRPGLSFATGNFDLAALGLRDLHLVRAMNVLRGYPPRALAPAQAALGNALRAGGLLVEGTSDTKGHVLSAHLWQRQAPERLTYAGLLLTTDFARGFAPRLFRDYLPRDLRRDVRPGEPVHGLLHDWQSAWSACRAGLPPAEAFTRSLERLAEQRDDVAAIAGLHGAALWRPVAPSSRAEVFGGRLRGVPWFLRHDSDGLRHRLTMPRP